MKILVLNCGSSSIKYKLFEGQEPVASGLIERIGEKGSSVRDHKQGIRLMLRQLAASGRIRSLEEIDAIGHRAVHGGQLSRSCLIDENVLKTIKRLVKAIKEKNKPNSVSDKFLAKNNLKR